MNKDIKNSFLFFASAFAAVFLFIYFYAAGNIQTVGGYFPTAAEIENNSHIPQPANEYALRSSLFNAVLPAVSCGRQRTVGNSPLNHEHCSLFTRTFCDFKIILCRYVCETDGSICQKYIKNSIPVRAGPLC